MVNLCLFITNMNEINHHFLPDLQYAIAYALKKNQLIKTDDNSIVNYKNIGIVYFIYVINKKDKSISLVYIGKSKGSLFKTRIRNHFYKKHPKTGSKLAMVQDELIKGNELKLQFLKVNPESFRNTLEEELINHFRPIWNIQKRRK
jgi:hypothetical protein